MKRQNSLKDLIDESLIPMIGKTAKYMGLFISDHLAKHQFDLTKEQFLLLKVLHHEDGRAQKELAFITNRNKGSLARLISNMEKKNLVLRVISKEDKRINQVFLTENGRKTFHEILPILKEVIDQFQKGISEEEIRIVKSILQKINHNINDKENACNSG